ncbi:MULTISPECIES: glycosyltransferase family 4 protein [unclassified Thermotoga]|uniref:glycosyltransferase family 4 protein n=1 Tax=unclassified Thermotoga TaxID=2631113 RepID=UPI000280E6B0|nr:MULTISPECIES: glycosyltransferase family 4 protein [unclassified Thermotoga]AIY85866.1 glycosyl transferase, group 1 family protein [Thermotoga sp. 2812B]EJX26848.1 glycosyl transferase, group 1 family protein [Thermotoga sp. EMP]
MKVLILTNLFPRKDNLNSGIFITKRLKEYRKLGADFTAVSLAFRDKGRLLSLLRSLLRKPSEIPLEELEGVSFNPVFVERGLFDVAVQKLWTMKKALENFTDRFAEKIPREFPKHTVIHAHGMYLPAPAGVVARKVSEIWNVPYVVTLHGSDVNLNMARRDVRDIYLETLENAARCIFVSRALLEKAKSFGYSGQNAVVIPNGYDPDVFKPMDKNAVRKELGIYKENTHYVGFVGNLVPIKRADKLPEIFGKIAKELPNTRFLIVGDGVLKDKILKEMKGLDVVFTGRVVQTKVAKYMNAMDVMVLPSRNEGWPCVVLEAQACGTCVIGSSNGGIPEAIGFPEYVVEEGNRFEERFAKRVVQVLREGYDMNKLLERAKGFAWKYIVEKEIDVYKRVVRKP